MNTQSIQALTDAKAPEWAVSVQQWRPDGVGDSHYRMIDGPRPVVAAGNHDDQPIVNHRA